MFAASLTLCSLFVFVASQQGECLEIAQNDCYSYFESSSTLNYPPTDSFNYVSSTGTTRVLPFAGTGVQLPHACTAIFLVADNGDRSPIFFGSQLLLELQFVDETVQGPNPPYMPLVAVATPGVNHYYVSPMMTDTYIPHYTVSLHVTNNACYLPTVGGERFSAAEFCFAVSHIGGPVEELDFLISLTDLKFGNTLGGLGFRANGSYDVTNFENDVTLAPMTNETILEGYCSGNLQEKRPNYFKRQ